MPLAHQKRPRVATADTHLRQPQVAHGPMLSSWWGVNRQKSLPSWGPKTDEQSTQHEGRQRCGEPQQAAAGSRAPGRREQRVCSHRLEGGRRPCGCPVKSGSGGGTSPCEGPGAGEPVRPEGVPRSRGLAAGQGRGGGTGTGPCMSSGFCSVRDAASPSDVL